MIEHVDVAIVGGGPGGSTLACYLRKFAPHLSVLVLEREKFPRDHVGESQLPPVSRILAEIDCWDKVEAAGFPIKLGATYKWGKSKELWDFEFFPAPLFKDEPRPAKFEGQRMWTAFQVDRAIYDEILLDHAAELGAEVRQETRVVSVETSDNQVTTLKLEGDREVRAKWYVDASGHAGILRRALGVEAPPRTLLQNVAFWDYWQNADWAVSIGVGGTRVQVISVGFGWIWFIPLGPTRTSVGLVCPADWFKKSGKKPQDVYREALTLDPLIVSLLTNATSEEKFSTTKDWSFMADKHVGPNWFLVGEAGGFADPILAAGLTLTQASAREAAATIMELERGTFDPSWLRSQYEERQKSRITSHIRFAEYWYTANSQFTELKEFTTEIAREAGLELSPDAAWRWLAQGGFIDPEGQIGVAGFGTHQIKQLGEFLGDIGPDPVVKRCNRYRLTLEGAEFRPTARYGAGRITEGGAYHRGDRVLPLTGVLSEVVRFLSATDNLTGLVELMRAALESHGRDPHYGNEIIGRIPHAIEALVTDGWVEAWFDDSVPMRDLPERVANILHWNTDNQVR